jgi:hypothetical protein
MYFIHNSRPEADLTPGSSAPDPKAEPPPHSSCRGAWPLQLSNLSIPSSHTPVHLNHILHHHAIYSSFRYLSDLDFTPGLAFKDHLHLLTRPDPRESGRISRARGVSLSRRGTARRSHKVPADRSTAGLGPARSNRACGHCGYWFPRTNTPHGDL